jgi:cytochrome P450
LISCDTIGGMTSTLLFVPPEQPLAGLPWLRTVLRNPIEAWPAEIYREPIFESRVLGRPVAFVMAPQLVRDVLVTSSASFDKGDLTRRTLVPALGEALLTAEGEHWRWQRRAAAPTFRPDAMAPYFPAVQAAVERRRAHWASLPDGTSLDIAREMMRMTFDAILDAMLTGRQSMDADRVERAITSYLSSVAWVTVLALTRMPAWTPFPGRLRTALARRFLRRAAREAVEKSRRSSDQSTLIASLAKASDPATGRTMNNVDLADNFLTFMTAGHETTALALTWTWYLLALHPDVEQRVLAEVRQCTRERPLAYEDLARLDLTTRVVQESMRLFPPAPIIVRRAVEDVRIGERVISRGTNVYVPVYAIHRHEKLWRDPNEFDPDRFIPERAAARDRYAYLPFGAGPRVCIGSSFAMMEAVAMLASLIGGYRLSLRSDQTPQLAVRVTLRPARGLIMELHKRPA